MALGQNTNTIYLGIRDGKVTAGSEVYNYVEGAITRRIYKKKSTFGREQVERWYITLEDEGTQYALVLPYESGAFKSIVLSLASDETLRKGSFVRIEPYLSRNLTKVVTYSDGVKLDWVTKELPAQKVIVVGGKEYRDKSEQMAFIEDIVNNINNKIF